MGRTGHRLTSIAAGCLVAAGCWRHTGYTSLLAIPAGYFGGTAPNWLEIAHAEYSTKYQRWMRKSVIPHRTITHWWPVWAVVSALVVVWPFTATGTWSLLQPAGLMMLRIALADFVAGAWMHLFMDIPNPTSIPILSPRARSRFGFGWWKSGNALELLAGVLMVVGAGALLFIVARQGSLPTSAFGASLAASRAEADKADKAAIFTQGYPIATLFHSIGSSL